MTCLFLCSLVLAATDDFSDDLQAAALAATVKVVNPKRNVDGSGVLFATRDTFAYVLTADLPEFLAIREDLLLQVGGIVESAGTAFAQPNQLLYVEGDGGGRERTPEPREGLTR